MGAQRKPLVAEMQNQFDKENYGVYSGHKKAN